MHYVIDSTTLFVSASSNNSASSSASSSCREEILERNPLLSGVDDMDNEKDLIMQAEMNGRLIADTSDTAHQHHHHYAHLSVAGSIKGQQGSFQNFKQPTVVELDMQAVNPKSSTVVKLNALQQDHQISPKRVGTQATANRKSKSSSSCLEAFTIFTRFSSPSVFLYFFAIILLIFVLFINTYQNDHSLRLATPLFDTATFVHTSTHTRPHRQTD